MLSLFQEKVEEDATRDEATWRSI